MKDRWEIDELPPQHGLEPRRDAEELGGTTSIAEWPFDHMGGTPGTCSRAAIASTVRSASRAAA